jgi:AcrR family transcriptional regulator
MPHDVNPRRTYDSTRRREQARATRARVVAAANEAFVQHGYAATTMPSIAAAADTSVETVYKSFGNKAALAKAAFDVAVAGDDEPVPIMMRPAILAIKAEPDPRRKLERFGVHVGEISGRIGPIMLVVRDAASTDSGAADIWATMQAERLTGMTLFAEELAGNKSLRRGVSVDEARDVLWTHNSVELWDLLVRQRGWTNARFGRWVGRQLIAALL